MKDELHDLYSRAFEKGLKERKHRTVVQYPFSNHPLVQGIDKGQSLPIFAYGSLMNKKSAARSIAKKTYQKSMLVQAFGVRREFTRIRKDGKCTHLNLSFTGNFQDQANGRLFLVSEKDDVQKLCLREKHYDLIPMVCVPYHHTTAKATKKQTWDCANVTSVQTLLEKCPAMIPCWGFSTPDTKPNLLSHSIEPDYAYFKKVEEAAQSGGKEFYQSWLNTTYLGSGKLVSQEKRREKKKS